MGVGDLVFVLLLVFYICMEQPLLMMVLAWVLVLVFALNSVGKLGIGVGFVPFYKAVIGLVCVIVLMSVFSSASISVVW